MEQLAWRNYCANSVYRAQYAQRVMQEVGKLLHEQVLALDVSEPTIKSVAIALKSLIASCTVNGADKPNAVVRELTRVADIKQEKIEDAVRELFEQARSGRGKHAFRNFSSQPVLMTAQDAEEQRALTAASQDASKLFHSISTAFEEYNAARSRLNVPQFVERLERAQADRDTDKFDQIGREQKVAEANLFVAATHFHSVISQYKTKIEAFSAVIKTAAALIPEVRGNKWLVYASNCMGAWHWLREMEMQLDICWRYHNPLTVLEQLNFDAEAFLSAGYPGSPASASTMTLTPLA
jgi:hypothetical protein